ncbi:MAG: hypothetical protein AAF800_14515 [Planctomycetota bacterium]
MGREVWLTDLSLDPTGTCIYFVVDSTWSGRASGVPVVRFDLDTGRRTVLCFLGPLLFANFGYVPVGGYTAVVNPEGRRLVMQLNGSFTGDPEDAKYEQPTVVEIALDPMD